MQSKTRVFGGLTCLFAAYALSQASAPAITAIVSFGNGHTFSPGSYGFAFVSNLGTLPTVTVDGVSAQLFTITSTSVAFQVPRTVSVGQGSVVVRSSTGQTAPFTIPITATSPIIALNNVSLPPSYFFDIVPQFTAYPTPSTGQRVYIYVDGLGASVPPPAPRVQIDGNDIPILTVTSFNAFIGTSVEGPLPAVGFEMPGLPGGPHVLTVIAGSITSAPAPFTLISEGLVTSQTGLSFVAIQDGPQPPEQSYSILSGQGVLNFSLAPTTVSGGNWLSVSPASGSSNFGAAGTPVQVQVNSSGLTAGTYYGQIAVSAPGVSDSPQIVTIVLNISPPNTSLGPSVDTTGLLFVGSPGGTNPGAQTVTLFNPTSLSVSFSSTLTVTPTGSGAVFSTNVSSGTLSSGQSLAVNVQTSSSVAAGVYSGKLTYTFGGGSTRTVNLLLVLAAGAAPSTNAIASARMNAATSACTPTKLLPVFTLLGDNFTVPAAWPTPIAATIADDCGVLLTAGTVGVAFSNGDPPLHLTSNQNGIWSATWPPVNARPSGIVLTLSAVQQETNLSGSVQIGGGVSPNANIPIVSPGGVVETASYSSPAAPGNLIAIFGTTLASGSTSAMSVPLPQSLANSSVILSGQVLPLFYAGDTQINAVVPYGLTPNTRYQLVVESGNSISVPQDVLIGVARPAAFTIDASGHGQGQIYKYDAAGNQILAGPDSPATTGDALVIYCSGLGEVSPPLAAGTATPLTFLTNTVAPVTVTIGGVSAPVAFAGLTPGSVALYQINVTVPAGLSDNDAMPLQIFAAAQNSAIVTFAFHQ